MNRVKGKLFMTLALAILAIGLLAGCNNQEPNITINNQVVNPSMMGAGVYNVHMDIVNQGGSDTLKSFTIAEYPAGRYELHDVKDGQMFQIPEIKIPASSTVELKRGSLHLMLFDLPEVEEIEQELTFIFNFERSGDMTVKIKLAMQSAQPMGD